MAIDADAFKAFEAERHPRERIRSEFGRLLEELRDGERFAIPAVVKLASGRRSAEPSA